MSFQAKDEKIIEEFFAAVAPYQSVYRYINFSYLAIKTGDKFHILRARLFMSTSPPAMQPQYFVSPHVRAGYHSLKALGFSDVRALINQLATGTLNTPNGHLSFLPPPAGHYAAAFAPFHPEGLTSQTRINVLTIMAGQIEA